MSAESRPHISPDMTIHLAAATRFEVWLQPMKRLGPAAVAKRNVRALHRFRVATRRSRALLQGLKNVINEDSRRTLIAQLRDLQHLTNPVRDIDVLLSAESRLRERIPDRRIAGADALFTWARERQIEAWAALAAERQSGEFQGKLRGWSRFVAQLHDPESLETGEAGTESAVAWVARTMRDSFDALAEKMSPGDGEFTDEALHRIRIRIKVLRYRLEAFSDLLDRKKHSAAIRRMKSLQNRLGAVNDLVSQIRFFSEHHEEIASAAGDEAREVVSELLGSFNAELEATRKRAVKAARGFIHKGMPVTLPSATVHVPTTPRVTALQP